jgi:hypothetical protein
MAWDVMPRRPGWHVTRAVLVVAQVWGRREQYQRFRVMGI